MAFREVTVIETKEVLRLWRSGVAKKRIAAQLGVWVFRSIVIADSGRS